LALDPLDDFRGGERGRVGTLYCFCPWTPKTLVTPMMLCPWPCIRGSVPVFCWGLASCPLIRLFSKSWICH